MPVSTDLGEPSAKRCKSCDESTHGVDGPASWRLTLDQDLIDTLKTAFPHWFVNPLGNNNTTTSTIAANSSSSEASPNKSGSSPPHLQLHHHIHHQQRHRRQQQQTVVDRIINKNMAEGERLSNSSAIPRSPLLSSDDSGTHKSTTETTTRRSPPKAIVDSSPLQAAMGKNKESLKVKLMVRRPITQLVEQGIMPPLKTSPALHEQRKQLERAKTGDLLKAKIQQRPDRQELERRHILEHEESHVDPSLAEKQRMLKKARLADQLNSQISHRPGPLELIKKNILHTEEPIERIVKEGLVSFKATSEGLLNRPQHPSSYITFEEDSQSSEGDLRCSPSRQDVLEAAAASAGIVTVALTIPTNEGSVVVTTAPILQPPLTAKLEPPTRIASPPYIPPPPPLPPPPAPPAVVIKTEPVQQQQQQIHHHHHHHQLQSDTSHLFAELCQSVIGNSSLISLTSAPSPVSLGSSISTLSPLSSVASPPNLLSRSSQSPLQQSQSQCQKSDAPGKDKNRKKNKSKPVAKARTIKFHEYKGPPNAQKSSGSSLTPVETSYELLLKQQNFLLEYLEGLHKHPTILPAPPKSNQSELSSSFAVQNNAQFNQPLPSPAPSVCSSVPNSPAPSYADSISSEITRLEKMKVSDLKLLLKQRNLPVSGPKPQLIERLKQVLPLEFADTSASESISGETCDLEAINSPRVSMSPESENEQMDIQQVDSPVSHYHHQQQVATPPQPSPEDLLREQQRKIDELQRKLRESQEELLQMKQHQLGSDQPVNQKLIVKQQLEAKIHKEKLQQLEHQARLQKEHVAFQLSQQNLQNQQNLAVAAAAAAAAATASIKQQPLLAPKKEENCTFLFGDQQMQLTTTHKKQPVEIVWNGNSPLFLLGVQDSKKLLASQQHRTAASMPQIVLPITTATAHPMEAIIEKASFQTQLQQQQHPIQLQQQQQRQQPAPPPPQPMQIVQIDVQQPQVQQVQQVAAPQPPPLQQQPPPPQYEEATKELENNRKQKETSSKKSSHIKSNTVTDVLEILIKNGELPESAVHDPTTPTTPAITMQQQPTLVYAATSVAPHTVEIAHIQRSSPAPSPQRAIEKPSVSQYNEKICSPLMLDTSLQTHNVEMISPVESEVKTLDILLGQAQKSTSNSGGGGGNSTLSLDHEHRNEDINQFDPMELMELMGHPLDMDIGDEGCHSYVLDKQELGMGTMHSVRDMNPSLQPSLNDLIMQQQQQQQHQPHSQSSSYSSDYNQNSINCGGHSNNNYISSPMDVEDFENSLSSFDFSTIADVHDNQVNHNSSDPFGQLSQQSSLQNGGVDQNSYDSHLSMNHDNILDFFNIDDLKMTGDTVAWGEVDFAV